MTELIYDFEKVMSIIRKLRSKDGCPWDNEQTFQTLRKYLLEETYEALDAIDKNDMEGLSEELGDCIWEILFIARIAEQDGHFSIDDVVSQLGEKMVRRHPHIFGEEKLENSEQVLKQWAQIKLEEGKTSRTGDILSKIPKSMPALLRAYRIGERVAKVGFDWENPQQVMEKFREELFEFDEAIKSKDQNKIEDELGDALFALAQVARHLEVSPEDALRRASDKFIRRYARIEKKAAKENVILEDLNIDELEALWQQAKKEVG